MPVNLVERYNEFNTTYDRLKDELGRNPTVDEIVKEMSITEERAKALIRLKNGSFIPFSLNSFIDNEEKSELGSVIPDDNIDIAGDFESKELQQNIIVLLDNCGLDEREKKVILLKYGFLSDKPMTLEKIGNLLKITRERVRQIESRALKKIINSSSIKEFAFYMDNPDQTLANLQNIRNFYNKGGNKKIKIQDSKTTDTKQVKRIKTIYELLNGFKKEEINLVIKNLSLNYKHLLELRYGNDLDNPVTSPEWNINLAHNFYRNLIPKMRRKLMENRENNSVDIKVSLKDLLLRMDIKDVIIICLKDGYFNKTYSDIHLKKYLFVSDEDINNALNKLNVSKGIRNEECLEEIDIEHLTELKGMNLINSLCNLSVAEFIVLTLLMGYANGYYYKINEISALLQVDEETVSKILKSALIKFREEINKMIKEPVKKLNLDK